VSIVPSTLSKFRVSNTTISDISGAAALYVGPIGTASVQRVLSKVTAYNNNTGFWVNSGNTTGTAIRVTIIDSEASYNSSVGVSAYSPFGSTTVVIMLRNFVASYNNTAFSAVGTGIIRLAHSMVTGNLNVIDSGNLNSYGDNDIDGNSNNNWSSLITLSQH
jgi:hypothetical protein